MTSVENSCRVGGKKRVRSPSSSSRYCCDIPAHEIPREVTNDIEAFNAQMGSSLNAPVYPAVGNQYDCPFFHTAPPSSQSLNLSESAPVNSFPRNTTKDHAQDQQYVFDTTSAGWEVRKTRSCSCTIRAQVFVPRGGLVRPPLTKSGMSQEATPKWFLTRS